jgi:NAD(P)-dependent dehydrogenase (short-subunit alcohol dehydrogenase family)
VCVFAVVACDGTQDFTGQVVAILGATGIVGSGVALKYLEAGARVVAVGREGKKLESLSATLTKVGAKLSKDNWVTVVGDFTDEKASKAAADAIVKAAGKPLNHIVSNLGFVKTTAGGPTASSLKDLNEAFAESLNPTLLSAQQLLPLLKDVKGSSYTISSGGFSHFTPAPGFWTATVKNAALNALTLGLAKEFESAAVRVNTACIHFGVSEFDGSKNQLGFPAADTRRLAPVYLTLAASNKRGLVQCLPAIEDAEALAHSLLK